MSIANSFSVKGGILSLLPLLLAEIFVLFELVADLMNAKGELS